MKKRSSCNINGFKYPSSDKIGGRTSTICRSMACTLLLREACSPEDEERWKRFFPNKTCAYCGKKATHLDHLFPLIIDRKPTGYGTEPANLVPVCSDCNQSKGNLDWEEYMNSDKCKHVIDKCDLEASIKNRIDIIKEFQKEMVPNKITIDPETMEKWDQILKSFDDQLNNAEKILLEIKKKLYGDKD